MLVSQSPQQNTVGRCIYCGTDKGRLTREHVVPRSLGGNLTLPKASCDPCAKLTAKLEGYIARRIFGDLRVQHGFPAKERPTHLPVWDALGKDADPPPESAKHLVPVKDHPGFIGTFVPEPAGLLMGRPRNAPFKGNPVFRPVTSDGEARMDRLKAQGLETKLHRQLDIGLIGRFYAKVALGMAVAGCGIDGFLNRLGPVVTGQDADWPHWVGGTTPDMLEFDPPTHGKMVLHRSAVYWNMREDGPWLLAQVQLCAYFGLPIYTVVVGELLEAGRHKLESRKQILNAKPI